MSVSGTSGSASVSSGVTQTVSVTVLVAEREGGAVAARESRTARAASAPARRGPPLPPVSSTTGRRYYVFFPREGSPWVDGLIVCGQDAAREELGGNWFGHSLGQNPTGFAGLEEAVNAFAVRSGRDEVALRWR